MLVARQAATRHVWYGCCRGSRVAVCLWTEWNGEVARYEGRRPSPGKEAGEAASAPRRLLVKAAGMQGHAASAAARVQRVWLGS